MASHRLIIQLEDQICAARTVLENAQGLYGLEVLRDTTGRGYLENHDHWGTLLVNARILRREIDRLIQEMALEFPE